MSNSKKIRVAVPMTSDLYAIISWKAELEKRTPANFLENVLDKLFAEEQASLPVGE